MLTKSQLDRSEREAGYMLLAVVAMVAIVLIALAVAAPVIAKDLRRDKEVESERRAEQYVRAIRLYHLKTNTYPPSMEALEKTNNVRYLRQKYIDPLTGKSDWRLIHQPVTKIKYPFGEELAGLPTGGLGSAAGLASGVGSSPGTAGTPGQTVTSTNALNGGFGGAQIGGDAGSSGATGSVGASGSTGATSSPLSGGGGVIYGVGPNRTGNSILNPNQQETYETWEFWYDPRIEALYKLASFTGGGGLGSASASSMGQDATTAGSNGASGSTGATSGFGSSTFGNSGPGASTGSVGGGIFGSSH